MSPSSTRLSVLRANLRSSGKRLWAAGAAIAISAAFFVAGALLVESMTTVVTEEAEQEAAGADVMVSTMSLDTGSQQQPGDVSLAESIEQLEPVDSAQVIRTSYLETAPDASSGAGGDAGVFLPVSTMAEGRDYALSQGRAPQAADELLISSQAAEWNELAVGETLTAVYQDWEDDAASPAPENPTDFTVVGVTGDLSQDEGVMIPEGIDRLPSGPEETGGFAQPQQIRVVLTEGLRGDPAAQESAQQEVAELVETLIASGDLPAEAADMGIATHQQMVDAWVADRTGDAQMMQWIAFGFGSIAIFVSVLVIANTFQVIVASRQRTMALIRAVGGTAAQLRRATLAEGALLGLLGGAVGVLLGWGIAQGLVAVMNHYDSTGAGLPAALPGPLIIGAGMGLGLILAVCAALFPALKAGRVSPMAALRPADVVAPEAGASLRRAVLGGVVTAAGIGTVFYAAVGRPDTDRPEGSYDVFNVDPVTGAPYPVLGVLGAIIGFIGVLILAKVVIPPLVALLGRWLSASGIGPVSAKLAGQNARQVPGRTAATAAALLVGVTLVITMTVGAATVQKLLYTEMTESYPVDGVVVGPQDEQLTGLEDHELVETLAAVPGLQASAPDGNEVTVLVLDDEAVEAAAHSSMTELEGAAADGYADWSLGAQADHTASGSGLPLSPTAGGASADFDVHTTSWVPPDTVIIFESALPADWETSDSAGVLLRLADGATEEGIWSLGGELEGADSPVFSLTGAAMRAELVQIIDTMLLAVIALLGASVFVAVIGVSNTLSLSVFERKREGALLRATGMTRRSLGATISIEALLLAAVALVLGTALGVFFAWAGISTLMTRDDWNVVVEIPWLRLAAVWGVTLLAASAASWLPARRLSKVQPAAGLSQAA